MDYGGKRILKHYTLVENRGLSRGRLGAGQGQEGRVWYARKRCGGWVILGVEN